MKALVLLAFGLFLAGCSTTPSDVLQTTVPPPLETENYAALVVDATSGKTLYQVNASAYRYPASLTKMMTLYMVFENLSSGRLSLASELPVSRHCASQAPSKLGLKAGTTIDVDSAINAIAVKSANDAACAVGEYLGGGSEDRFAELMTARAHSIGMANSTFRNASGLPDPDQRVTARDMATLGIALRRRFPQHFGRFSARSFAFHGREIRGHNHLLGRVEGVDGIKTGYIRASGFNIVTSVSRRGKRLIVVVMGGKSGRERDAHVEALIERFLPGLGARPAPVIAAPRPIETAAPAITEDGDLPGVGAASPPASGASQAPSQPESVPSASNLPAGPADMGDGFDTAD